MSVHVFTSITPNYLPKARVLAESVKRFLPNCLFHLQMVDSIPRDLTLEKEPFDSVMGIDDLGLDRPEQWLFKHSVVEACTGVKGFALKNLLSRQDSSAVLYLDPDIVVLAPLNHLATRLQTTSILLTPHLTEPEATEEAIRDNEFSVLKHGIYNLGFLGVRNSAEGRRFAEWWASRLEDFCYDDIPSGLFTDQRWADLAPAYFADLEILRDPGYNVATWNLTHRRVEGNLRDGFTAAGEPLYFYHFSGFDSGAQLAMLEKYGADMPALYELRDWYLSECDRLGQTECGNSSWTHDFFENGERVTTLHRKRYRERIDLQRAFPNPYRTRDVSQSYYHWFEANDESRISVVAASPPQAEVQPSDQRLSGRMPIRPADPIYRVYLSICGSDANTAGRAIADLRARAFRKDALYVIGPQRLLEELPAEEETRRAVSTVCLPEQASHEDAFREVATGSAGEWDFVFLTPEVIVPELFDLRLAWTAARMEGAGAVSPINDQLAATGLGIAHTRESVTTLDRVCYHHSQFWNPEIWTFLAECAYFDRRAVRDVLAGPAPLTFGGFVERLKQHRWPQILADHVFTGTLAPPANPPAYATSEPLVSLRADLMDHLEHSATLPGGPITRVGRRRHLHVLHSWGGGLEKWVADYCHADREHENFVLKSIGNWGSFGLELRLYRDIEDSVPLQVWPLAPAIRHTASVHSGYQAALSEIIDRYGIDAIFISSLIGHSLDAIEAGVPAVVICHDYYPFCPALNITFGEVCRRCNENDLVRCTESNPHHRFFLNVPHSDWINLREQFADRVLRRKLPLVAPSPSVRNHYAELLPELRDAFQIIPHGVKGFDQRLLQIGERPDDRLRIVILGSLAPHKGLNLLKAMEPHLRHFADLFLVGCGEFGRTFQGSSKIQVIPQYNRDELPDLLQAIGPDLGLLLSVVPETFSYTLQELMELGVPTLATRVRSFADFIEDGVTGFLADPEPSSLLNRLRELDDDRRSLRAVRAALGQRHTRHLRDMCADYERLLNLPSYSARAYFASGSSAAPRDGVIRGFQLMWREAGGVFQEAESFRCRISASGADQVTALKIPPRDRPPAELRLDLGEEPGFLVLRRVELRTSSNQSLWRWENAEGAIQGARNGVEVLGGSGLLYLSSNDPHWILPVKNGLEELRGGGWLEVEFQYPSLHSITGASSENGRGSSPQRLLQQLAEARLRIADLEGSLSWRITRPLREIWGAVLRWRA